MRETDIIKTFFAPLATHAGAFALNDDAAELTLNTAQNLVITSDNAIEGRHFTADTPPNLIAQKALRRNISDLIAKGADPIGLVHNIALKKDVSPKWLSTYTSGLKADSHAFSCPLLGGDTSSSDITLISITAFGTLGTHHLVRRNGARAGDSVFVTGTIGDAALAYSLGQGAPQELTSALFTPHIPFGVQSLVRAFATSSIDISDGFWGDAETLLSQSGVRLTLPFEAIPLSNSAKRYTANQDHVETILTGGDDYQTLFTAAPKDEAQLLQAAKTQGLTLTKLGTCEKGQNDSKALEITNNDSPIFPKVTKFSHFE